MTIFDLQKDALLQLSDSELEELIARLSEAELATNGHSPSRVFWSGSINSADGGVDIRVDVQAATFATGFLEKPNTIFQAKKHSMPASSITEEMRPGATLATVISQQAEIGGSYIIVSLADDCSEPMKKTRLKAMQDAMNGDPNRDAIHLDFYDRSRLLLWLRHYPAVIIWVRGVLGQALSGWQPYGSWSNTPVDADDVLILASGVSIILPTDTHQKLSIEEAIEPTRNLIRSTQKAIRITGLSGVGKTRIVQALFDETIGEDPLDRTSAVYVDAGADPDPSARAVLDRLITEDRTAILVLDNCPSDLHATLAARVTAAGSNVRLITVEYDIRDDKPQTTEVIHIEADGPEIAEQLLLRRFPGIGQSNARKIAEFGNGNARVALAVAERVEIGESLAHLSDANLFDRLFIQRNQPDGQLRAHAEALSLVYSFSVAAGEVGIDELAVLGSIYDAPRSQLFRSVSNLLDRHVAQKRAHWRAILPHAIANRLASDALNSVPVETLRSIFEAPGHERLLLSFAHRLGLMHDHPIAQEIVRSWLREDGPLGAISDLDDNGARMLDYVAPVAPDAVLDEIAAEINSAKFSGMESSYNPRRTTILSLLVSLAYESGAFDRCVGVLLRVADFEDESNNYDSVRDTIVRFFQAYLSGTHASLDQRVAVLRGALWSKAPARRTLGFRMLSAALDGPPWIGMGMNDFGARPRDFGFQPNYDELVQWRSRFIDIAVEVGLGEDHELAGRARSILAQEFRGLWWQAAIRDKLVEAAKALNDEQPWVEGWKAVRSAIYFDHRKKKPDEEVEPLPDELAELEAELAPTDLMSNIRTYVVGKGHDHWSLDDEFDDDDAKKYDASRKRLETTPQELGEAFACSGQPVSALGPELFSTEYMPYRVAFGRGLAVGSMDQSAMWGELLTALHDFGSDNFDFSVLCGFIEEIDEADREMTQDLLDQCLDDPALRQTLVRLHPPNSFDEHDLDRCMRAFEFPGVGARMYGELLWRDNYEGLPQHRLTDLAEQLLAKPNGDDVVLDALSMKLHRTDASADTLGVDLRRIGLIAATCRLLRSQEDPGGSVDRDMEKVVGSALTFDGHPEQKTAWLDAIFAVVDERYGYMHAFDIAVRTTASKLPVEFLDKLFSGDEETQQRRRLFVERGGMGQLPLSGVDVAVLIDWCQDRGEPDAWAVVAASIHHWHANEVDKSIRLSDAAVRLLESAPDPEPVLMAFAGRIEPRVSSGDRAEIMETRAASFRHLFDHPNTVISVAAQKVFSEASKWIDVERDRQRRWDEEREQRFE